MQMSTISERAQNVNQLVAAKAKKMITYSLHFGTNLELSQE